MQYRGFLFLLLLLGGISCKEDENTIPAHVLDKEKFSDVIVDFTLAESASGINVLNVPGQKTDTVYSFNPLLDNNITKAEFDTSLYFYSHHPKIFREVYEIALEKLSRMQASRK
ncbi:MAG: DUF4296 domain-containing protein [Bacteroidetes bacterium]|nr:DUF4296 domain-containing protein [Bacteroidota bacterium]